MSTPGANRSWPRHLAGTAGRLALLLALVVASGVLAGWALGAPLRSLDLDLGAAAQLDHRLLVSKLDIEQALVRQEDLTSRWAPGDPAIAGFGALNSSFCGEQPTLADPVGEPDARVFVNDSNSATLISQVVRNHKLQDADAYLRDVTAAIESCDKFFREVDGKQVAVSIRDERDDAPVTEYISRTLVPTDGESLVVVTFLQAGDAVIALTYIAPTRPEEGFLDRIEQAILGRIDPEQFGNSSAVEGSEELPADGVTKIDETGTTIVPADASSTTIGIETTASTEAPEPTFRSESN